MNKLKLLWLFEKDMNIYGDYGNILAVKKQAELRGIDLEIVKYNAGDEFPLDVDLVISGGGQDSGQNKIQEDLLKISENLKALVENNTPMLMICGLYQLFGDYFETSSGERIQGINLFQDVKTVAGDHRLIGNIVEDSEEFGEIVGYENHSGQTFLPKNFSALARVKSGEGNSLISDFEGARYKNVIGTYLHGALLPKNPQITTFLLSKALENKGSKLPPVSFSKNGLAEKINYITERAREVAIARPR